MFTSTFLPTNMYHVDQNPTNFTYMADNHADVDQNDLVPEFDLSDYLAFLDQLEDEYYSSSSFSTPSLSQSPPVSQEMTGSTTAGFVESSLNPVPVDGSKKRSGKMNNGELRVAFRMKTELEIVDDGYKWRKYGKKRVKTSPNPRNYYKCSNGGCSVKKRVERDGEDSSYVITTYDGVHNHESPSSTLYINYNTSSSN